MGRLTPVAVAIETCSMPGQIKGPETEATRIYQGMDAAQWWRRYDGDGGATIVEKWSYGRGIESGNDSSRKDHQSSVSKSMLRCIIFTVHMGPAWCTMLILHIRPPLMPTCKCEMFGCWSSFPRTPFTFTSHIDNSILHNAQAPPMSSCFALNKNPMGTKNKGMHPQYWPW